MSDQLSGNGRVTPIGIAISPEREQFLRQWVPFVRFQFPSELEDEQYRQWLQDLLLEFILAADERNQKVRQCCLACGLEWAGEGGITFVYIDGVYFDYVKLHLYRDQLPYYRDWRGPAFRDNAY